MINFKQQLFQQFASEGLGLLIADLRKRHKPKKGERFEYHGITYEIGPAQCSTKGIEFEISSKIPQDELPRGVALSDYFEAVKRIVVKAGKVPAAVDMENIIRKTEENETKERDYVKVKYLYGEKELYHEKRLSQQGESFTKDHAADRLPQIPGIQTLLGRLILVSVRDTIHQKAGENIQALMEANETVRKDLKARPAKRSPARR